MVLPLGGRVGHCPLFFSFLSKRLKKKEKQNIEKRSEHQSYD
jgi:hypothetical protein